MPLVNVTIVITVVFDRVNLKIQKTKVNEDGEICHDLQVSVIFIVQQQDILLRGYYCIVHDSKLSALNYFTILANTYTYINTKTKASQ